MGVSPDYVYGLCLHLSLLTDNVVSADQDGARLVDRTRKHL